MDEPTPRISRLVLALGAAASLALGGAGFVIGRATSPRPAAITPVAPATTQSDDEEAVLTGVLGRADLVALAAEAADAAATGRDFTPEIGAFDGRRFELRLPFGCDGPAEDGSNAPLRWRYDDQSQALRLHVQPTAWSVDEWFPNGEDERLQAIEGFWIERPWTTSEECPATGSGSLATGRGEEVTPIMTPDFPQTLAIAQLFTAEGSRRGRREGRPYQAVLRVPVDDFDSSRGFRLRVAGRIEASGGSGPVSCLPSSAPTAPPVCMIGAVLSEIAIENPATGETLAQWTLAGSDGDAGAQRGP